MVIILIVHTISNEVYQLHKANKNPFVAYVLFFFMSFGRPETYNNQPDFGSQWCCPKILNGICFSQIMIPKISIIKFCSKF